MACMIQKQATILMEATNYIPLHHICIGIRSCEIHMQITSCGIYPVSPIGLISYYSIQALQFLCFCNIASSIIQPLTKVKSFLNRKLDPEVLIVKNLQIGPYIQLKIYRLDHIPS